MKKAIIFLVTCIMSLSLFGGAVYANDEISVYIDGEKINFDSAPTIIDGRTLVPMRAIFEALGAEIEWDGETYTVYAKAPGVSLHLFIDDANFFRNSNKLTTDVAPMLINDRTYVPLRLVSECMGADVEWDADSKAVKIKRTDKIRRVEWNDNKYYIGEVVDGEINGYGILYDIADNSVVYSGLFDDDEIIYGDRYFGNFIYRGDFEDMLPDGDGIAFFDDGRQYIGEWKEGFPHGEGYMTYPNGDKYDGNWENGERHGYGTYYWAGGNKYEGNWENGEQLGYGTCYYANGGRYEGNWKNGKGHGYGTYYWANGDKYVGNHENGLANGEGIMYYASGDRYEGNWKNDKRHGYGTCYSVNGDKYEGNWENGELHGYGTYYWADGKKYVGNFENGERHGYGTYYYANGKREAVYYEHGELMDN